MTLILLVWFVRHVYTIYFKISTHIWTENTPNAACILFDLFSFTESYPKKFGADYYSAAHSSAYFCPSKSMLLLGLFRETCAGVYETKVHCEWSLYLFCAPFYAATTKRKMNCNTGCCGWWFSCWKDYYNIMVFWDTVIIESTLLYFLPIAFYGPQNGVLIANSSLFLAGSLIVLINW